MSRSPRRAPIAPVGDAAYRALKARIVARTGHHYYDDKDDQLWERLVDRMREAGTADPKVYLALLDGDRGAAEWRRLESAITINETFFFRFAEQFDVLRRILLPELMKRRAGERRLRIWSVGCSTGAEPYSIAILLADLLGDALADWRIAITGTDIDDQALSVARAARYSSWALRTLGEAERARLFDLEGKSYRLKPAYRGLVRFEHHNMMSLLDEATALQFVDFDLILCRNVLIYFSQADAVRIVGSLASRLAPDGHLFLGHAEPSPEFSDVATTDDVGGLIVYRRRDATPRATRPMAAGIVEAAEPPVRQRPPARPVRRRRIAPAPPPADIPPPSGVPLKALREALAMGEADTAVRLAEAESGRIPRDPVPHYLGALGALALGESARAERGFRNALYLDNRFAMAHYLLGRHLLAEGRGDEGRRALANAARAVAGLDPESPLVEGDGMTAGALADAVRSAVR